MSFNKPAFENYLEANKTRFIEELAELIRIPSVAAQNRGIQACAEAVSARLRAIGAKVEQITSPHGGSPVIYAEIGEGERTLMIYNHYDVQPEVPVELWDSPPFELAQRDGKIYGRGTADDKGEFLARVQAIENWLKTQGELPIKIKFVVEGEEEVASTNLHAWVDANKSLLTADGVLWEGGGYDESGIRTIVEGCKGIAYFELHVSGAAYDLHSSWAPIIENPAWRLVWALSTLKDQQDNITIDGYAEHLITFDAETIQRIDDWPFNGAKIRSNFGLNGWLNGLDDNQARRRYLMNPTLTICGIESGYTGEGPKTVLPAKAWCKLDFRLVPHLTPEIVQDLLRQHLDKRGFGDIEIKLLGGENPSIQKPNLLLRKATIRAFEQTFNETPAVMPWFAGSGPMYLLSDYLGIPAIAAGATWHPEARAHSPNENIYEQDYFDAMCLTAALIDSFGSLDSE